jgi:hypothetical protein
MKSKLNNTLNVSGEKTFEIADKARIFDESVIRPFAQAYHKQGGIAVLYGNLAPDGAVVKQSGVSDKMMKFSGKAKVFDREEEAMRAIMGNKIKKGDCIVIRYEGPGSNRLDCRPGLERFGSLDYRRAFFRRDKRTLYRAYFTGGLRRRTDCNNQEW